MHNAPKISTVSRSLPSMVAIVSNRNKDSVDILGKDASLLGTYLVFIVPSAHTSRFAVP